MGSTTKRILTSKKTYKLGNFLAIEARPLDMQIRLPFAGPIQAALTNTESDFIQIEVIEGRRSGVNFYV